MVATTNLQISTQVDPAEKQESAANMNGKSTPTTLVTTPSSITTLRPQSFSISALHASDFNAQDFIADRRQYAPLSLVRDELRSYVSSLSSQIVQALQKDFNLFLNFGPSLSDATMLAKAFSPALNKLNTELDNLDNHLQVQANALNIALSNRHEINSRRVALQTLVSVHDSLVKCERLLRQYSSLSSNPLSTQALSLLDRITSETAQLSFTLLRAQSCEFLNSLSNRISTVKRQVRASLDLCLQKALPNHPKPFDPDILSTVLALYVVAGMQDDAHDFFTRQVVTPFTSQRLRIGVMLSVAERNSKQNSSQSKSKSKSNPKSTSTNANANTSISVTPGDALRAARDEIVTFLGDRVLPLVSLCQSDSRLAKRLDFVGQSVWPQIQKAISSNMSPAFSPGIPDVFHQSFRAGVDIFSAVESTADDDFRSTLRSSKTTSEFWRHWNLPVYFQLRFQEITSSFESYLSDGPIAIKSANKTTSSSTKTTSTVSNTIDIMSTNSSSMDARLLRTDVYRSTASAALVACLRRCWSDDVFLPALTHRFVRLSLQLIARYSTWVRTGLAGEWITNKEGIEKGAARIIHDIGVIQTRLPAELASVLRSRCPSLNVDIVEAIESGFAEAVDRYNGLIPDVVESIADTLGQTCTENLKPLRGIIATYRLKSKQAPSRHSSFVPQILKPLRAFLKDYESLIEKDVGKKIAEKVMEITAKEYFNMATDSIERNKNNEATLKRLNIGRGNTTGKKESSGMSVVEKIAMQLFLDVEQFADDVAAFGINAEDVESLQKLRDSVKREKEGASTSKEGEEEETTEPTSTSSK